MVRLRPGLVFQGAAGGEIARYFLGPFLPSSLVRPRLLPVLPDIGRLVLQGLHAEDMARAYVLAATSNVRGAFNVAADPLLDSPTLARLLGARRVPMPAAALRAAVWTSWHLRLQPTDPGWLDLGLGVPGMDTTRARTELGWTPTRDVGEALLELLDGIRSGAGAPTPTMRPRDPVAVRLPRALRAGRTGQH